MLCSHADVFGLIWPGFEISVSVATPKQYFNGGDWNYIFIVFGIGKKIT